MSVADDAVAQAVEAMKSCAKPIGDARTATNQATAGARTVHQQAARTGNPKLAAQLNDIATQLAQASSQLDTATSLLKSGKDDAEAAGTAESAEPMIGSLSRASTKAEHASTRIAGVKAKLEPLPAKVAHVLKGAHAQPLAAAITAALGTLPPALGAIGSAQDTISKSLAQIRATGDF